MIEMIVDSFAGGGGASTGIEMALGRSPDIAINHDATALAMHEVNHPQTLHLTSDIWDVDPVEACGGRPVGLLWASPDCKHFSKAKGGKPVEKKIRGLAWVVVHWANTVRPRVIILENVEEFQTWGPLGKDGRPCPLQKGLTFKRWVSELERLGYVVEWRELRACHYGAPTLRKRLFLIARCDGEAITWPAPTHKLVKAYRDGRADVEKIVPPVVDDLKPARVAAEIIDWSLPCPSIFDTAAQIMDKYKLRAVRPLQKATMARLAKGVRRYVVDAARPFIVNLTHHGAGQTQDVDDPLATVTGAHRGEKGLVEPFIVRTDNASSAPRAGVHGIQDPVRTITSAGGAAPLGVVAASLVKNNFGDKPHYAVDEPVKTIVAGGNHHALSAAFLAQNNYLEPGHDAREPLSTVVGKGSTQSVAAVNLLRQFGTGVGSSVDEPTRTVMADGAGKTQLSAAFLQKYYGTGDGQLPDAPLHTVTTKDRFGFAEAQLEIPPFLPEYAPRARLVADLLRAHGLWDDREFVTVEIGGITCIIVDIGMRMLTPRELFRAQGFPDSYIIDRKPDGSPITKTEQVSKCGNSVCPPMVAALVKANYAPRDVEPAPQFMEAAE